MKKSDRILTTKDIIKDFCDIYGYEEEYIYKVFKTVRDDILKNFIESKPEFRVRNFGMFFSPIKPTERALKKLKSKIKNAEKATFLKLDVEELKTKQTKLEQRVEKSKENKILIDNSTLRIKNPYSKLSMSIKKIKNA
jgi:FtsZ-binding cell division protein ZapB